MSWTRFKWCLGMAAFHAVPCMFSFDIAEKQGFRVAYIGSSYYPSGKIAEWGVNSKRALLMALDDANKQGWCGKMCEIQLPESLIFEANGTAPPMRNGKALVEFVRRALDAGVVAILGADWERVLTAVLGELQRLNVSIPVISGGVTGANFRDAATYPNLFLTAANDATGIRALIQNMMARAEVQKQFVATPPEAVVLYSLEPMGENGVPVMKSSSLWGGPRIVAEAGFPSGASVEIISLSVKDLLSPYNVSKKKPLVLIAATGPDTTSAMRALAKEGIFGPPAGNWIVGAMEAAESVIETPEDVESSSGYNSYLALPPIGGTCPRFDEFVNRFNKLYATQPTGGFASSSYDSMVLLASALRRARAAASNDLEHNLSLLRAMRNASFGVQGLSGLLVFAPGENQLCQESLKITQLLATSTQEYLFRESQVASVPDAALRNCPLFEVAADVSPRYIACPSAAVASSVRFMCSPRQQNANICVSNSSGQSLDTWV